MVRTMPDKRRSQVTIVRVAIGNKRSTFNKQKDNYLAFHTERPIELLFVTNFFLFAGINRVGL